MQTFKAQIFSFRELTNKHLTIEGEWQYIMHSTLAEELFHYYWFIYHPITISQQVFVTQQQNTRYRYTIYSNTLYATFSSGELCGYSTPFLKMYCSFSLTNHSYCIMDLSVSANWNHAQADGMTINYVLFGNQKSRLHVLKKTSLKKVKLLASSTHMSTEVFGVAR